MDIGIQYATWSAFGLTPLVTMWWWGVLIVLLFFALYFFHKRLALLESQKSVVLGKIHQILDACLFVLYQKMPHDGSLRDMVRASLRHTDYNKQFDALQALASPYGLPDYHQPFDQLWGSYRSLGRWRLVFYCLSFLSWVLVLVALGGLGIALWVYLR